MVGEALKTAGSGSEAEPTAACSYYDVDLSEELQDVVFELCKKYEVDPVLALALMQRESGFRPDAVSKTNDYGLMQINQCNHAWLSEELGITDFLDAEQNMEAGLYILGGYLKKYDTHRALMSYNLGESGASKLIKQGYSSSKYSRGVVEIMQTMQVREEGYNEQVNRN